MMRFDYNLRLITKKDQLLTYIGIEEFWFDWASSFNVEAYDRAFSSSTDDETMSLVAIPFWRHSIPKKNPSREPRIVWEADSVLNNSYKGLARRLTRFFETMIPNFPHPKCCGYVRGRNIRDNAQFHIGTQQLLKVDIKNFFPTITARRITKYFEQLGVNVGIAGQLVNFLTIDGMLPLGLPTSPIIANALCHMLDFDLDELAHQSGCTYSRYADDITFSSNGILPKISDIRNIIERHHFNLANDKTRFSKRGQNHYVTGLSISASDAPHAPRKMKRNLRQELHFAQMHGLRDHIEHLGISDDHEQQRYINHLDGRVKYIAYHEPRLANKIVPLWQGILFESGDVVTFKPKNKSSRAFEFFVDETEFIWNGKKYLALGMSSSQHQDKLNVATKRIWEDYLANPWSDGDLKEIRKKGMHFTDATEDLRKAYLSALQLLPFNGYIVFGELTPDYQATYIRLLECILKRRLMAADNQYARFSFEQTSKVSKVAIEEAINSTWKHLRKANNRCPISVMTKIVDKKYYGVAVPDFLLAVFRGYMIIKQTDKAYQRKINMFEMLRDKIRVIVNADTGEEFTRRNPLKNEIEL